MTNDGSDTPKPKPTPVDPPSDSLSVEKLLKTGESLTPGVSEPVPPEQSVPTHQVSSFPKHLLSEDGLKKFEAEQAAGRDPDAEPSDYVAGVGRHYVGLSAQDRTTWRKAEDVSWGDHVLKPNKPLSPRQKEVARLAFLGKTNTEISERTGYSPSWVCTMLTNTKVQKEIERLQNKAFSATVNERLSDIGPQALEVIEEILSSEDKAVKPQLKVDVARWVVEKLSGKPRQEVDHQSSSLSHFMGIIDEMRKTGTVFNVPSKDVTPKLSAADPSLEVPFTDVTESNTVATTTPEGSDLKDWVRRNLGKP